MDVWTHGDPPRRFKVLGTIEDERPGGMIPMAQLKHDIVQKAGQNGGSAVIFVSSASQHERNQHQKSRGHTTPVVPLPEPKTGHEVTPPPPTPPPHAKL